LPQAGKKVVVKSPQLFRPDEVKKDMQRKEKFHLRRTWPFESCATHYTNRKQDCGKTMSKILFKKRTMKTTLYANFVTKP
jgi:hypothetical protein